MKEKEYTPKIAMSIQAHPDDQEFTIAGTLSKWGQSGCQIISVIVTSGNAGSNAKDKGADYKTELGEIREREQRAANHILGITDTIFLGYPDGELVHTLGLRKELTRLIRRYKPDVVVTGDPTRRFYGNEYINHPDHRAAADAACDAVFPSAGTRLIFTDLLEEGLDPYGVQRLYLWGAEDPDTWVDISTTLEIKIEALKQHISQLGDWDPTEMIREWARETGKVKDLVAAESYKVMVLDERERSEKST